MLLAPPHRLRRITLCVLIAVLLLLLLLLLLQGMSDEEVAAEMAPGPDDPQPLSPEEEEERQALMREGFSTWNRCARDADMCVHMCVCQCVCVPLARVPRDGFLCSAHVEFSSRH
jgi:hypothetical protein